jgi:hypothetical protein
MQTLASRVRGPPIVPRGLKEAVLLPAALERDHIAREQLKQEFIARKALNDPSKVGYVLSLISGQIGMQKNDFLRQVIGYEYPNYPWEKDNYFIRPECQHLVRKILAELDGISTQEPVTPPPLQG